MAPFGTRAEREVVDLHARTAGSTAEAPDRQRPLRQRDDLTVGPAQWRRQQRPALQAPRIAD
jgi:hypothetical protein